MHIFHCWHWITDFDKHREVKMKCKTYPILKQYRHYTRLKCCICGKIKERVGHFRFGGRYPWYNE